MNAKKENLLGSLAALITNIIFGFSFLFSKIALDFAHPLIILSMRFTIAFLTLNILWLIGIVKLNFKGKNLKKIILMAIMQPLLYFIFELYGINSTSSALSGVIISLVPVAVICFSSVFLKEKPTVFQIICSLVSLCGIGAISIMSNDGADNNLYGIFLLLGAVVCAAFFNILSRSESAKFSPFERTYMMFLVGSLGFNIIAVLGLRGEFLKELSVAACNLPFWYSIVYLAVVSSIIAFMLYNFATTKISAVKAASFSNIITVVSVLAGIFIMKEHLSVPQLVCCALIILGVWGVNK